MDDLVAIAERYVNSKILCREHAAQVRRVAARCGTLSVDAINEHIKRRLEQVSTTTARNERGLLLSLWRFAYESRLTDELPRGIVTVKARRSPTRAWTVEQLQNMLAKADSAKGWMKSGVHKRVVLRAWILLGYASGARFGDLWRFRREHVDGDVLRWTQHKTGEPLSKLLDKATIDAVHAMLAASPDGTILGWACSRGQAMRIMRAHLKECGLDGSSKWLRRSGATHVEMSQPGFGRHHCGHRTASMVEQHYLDWGQIRSRSPAPPSLVA